jgi:hypothetical protein
MRFGVALVGSLPEQACGLGLVLRDALALVVAEAKSV